MCGKVGNSREVGEATAVNQTGQSVFVCPSGHVVASPSLPPPSTSPLPPLCPPLYTRLPPLTCSAARRHCQDEGDSGGCGDNDAPPL